MRIFGASVSFVTLFAWTAVALPAGALLFIVKPSFMGAEQPTFINVVKSNLPFCSRNLISEAWHKCVAVTTLTNGAKYYGEFSKGKPNGVGEFVFPNQDRYVGEIEDGQPSGKGTSYNYANGETYVGSFANGRRNGSGTLTSLSGSKYVGAFKDGQRDEQGGSNPGGGSILDGIWGKAKSWAARPDNNGELKLKSVSAGYTVPIRFNDAITLEAIVDSGAADLVVPVHLLKTLMIAKTVTEKDMMGQEKYRLADGSEMVLQKFRIKSLQVGNRVLENVEAAAAPDGASILLGQNVLKRFGSWSIDNQRQVLVLK